MVKLDDKDFVRLLIKSVEEGLTRFVVAMSEEKRSVGSEKEIYRPVAAMVGSMVATTIIRNMTPNLTEDEVNAIIKEVKVSQRWAA